jgi:hypothetical protein
LRETPGHTRYYRKFIKGYAQITTHMEMLLKKKTKFQWNEDCQKGLDTLKKKLVTMPILIFPDWGKEFHVQVDALSIALGTVIAQFVARSKRLKDKGQTGETRTFPTQCHLNGEVLSI